DSRARHPRSEVAPSRGPFYAFPVRSTLRRRPVTRFAVTVLTALRVLALILGLQLSGAAHAATEAIELIASADVKHADACPPDGPCNDCPPSCPNCHCSNAPTA